MPIHNQNDPVQDTDRPDIGHFPLMWGIACRAERELQGSAPYLVVRVDDNLLSNVSIKGSLDAKDTWANGIWENSRGFRFTITPANGKRYYIGELLVEVELSSRHFAGPAFRKSTTTPEKAIERIKQWLEKNS